MSASQNKIPVNVYVEMTPNPTTMKFVADQMIFKSDEPVEYNSSAEAVGKSPLAEHLFGFPFIEKVFIVGNFVSLTKNNSIEWEMVNMELREFIKNFIEEGKVAVTNATVAPEQTQEKTEVIDSDYVPSPFDEQIKQLLDEYVKPAVESDGGAIDFKSYNEGKVTVTLRGACSGCPSSTMTLKGGIESLLKQFIPEVKEVVAEEM